MISKPISAEMHPGPGFRIRQEFEKAPQAIIDALRSFPTPDISDQLNRLYALDARIHCLTSKNSTLCGSACTVKLYPGDNLMVHKALDIAKPGEIVVIDSGGSTKNAVLGDIITTKASHRKIAGFVVDGLVRDLPGIEQVGLPVFARGTTPFGPLHRGPGELNYPISCGGVVINPGDIIVADVAGIVAVPKEIAADIVLRLEGFRESNAAYLDAVKRGEFSNDWVDKVLSAARCEVKAR